jgi:hypothetical protein
MARATGSSVKRVFPDLKYITNSSRLCVVCCGRASDSRLARDLNVNDPARTAMTYRILVTGAAAPAGRSMIDALGYEPTMLLACDTRMGTVDALPLAHCFNVHRSDDPEFVGDLVTLCAMHEIDVVVPTRASDQLALANVRKLFEGLGTCVWLAPIAEHATRSQARRIIQLGEQVRGESTVGRWFRRLSSRAQEQHHHSDLVL